MRTDGLAAPTSSIVAICERLNLDTVATLN